jgi:hypothetical protein
MEEVIFIAQDIKHSLIAFYHSGFFLTIKILAGVYTLVLFIDIILLLIQRGVSGNIREGIFGMDVPREILDKKKKARQDWLKITQKIETGNGNDYKIAIIEADAFADRLVAGLGYEGAAFGERLDNASEDHIVNVAGMKQAHQIRNKIIHEDNFVLSKNDALGVLAQYEEFLRSYQIID